MQLSDSAKSLQKKRKVATPHGSDKNATTETVVTRNNVEIKLQLPTGQIKMQLSVR